MSDASGRSNEMSDLEAATGPMRELSEASRGRDMREIAVVGLGPSGLAAALALAHVGADVVAVGPPPPASSDRPSETRTAALLAGSVDLLKALGVWEKLARHAAPLAAIRIIDASRSLVRAPDIEFRASELGLAAFGYNIANTVLVDTLYAQTKSFLPAVVPANVTGVVLEREHAILSVSEGEPILARLVAAVDGRRSICRTAAGIKASERPHDQAAIATSFAHTQPHENVSTELHKEEGSVTTVPLPDQKSSSLIWVGPVGEIKRLMTLEAERFADALSERLGGLLGAISEIGPRASFNVVSLSADRLAARRTVLLGEAAHILPPIGAQGLNLGFRDAASLADCMAQALERGRDPGGGELLEAYARSRGLDVMTRTVGVDLLSRSLLTSLPPLQAARGIVLHGLKALSPLRRAVMRIGLTPPSELPSLMRPVAD
jgi:2-octaprenyl-6-methoxyphenol hydroxylase